MFEVNITGAFMTAQAVAKQMIKFGNGGSIVMIASMSGSIANRVSIRSINSCLFYPLLHILTPSGFDMSRIQRLKSRCVAAGPQLSL